jgi:hypothetical protein
MLDDVTAKRTAEWFAKALANAQNPRLPYPHWLLDQALPIDVARGIPALPFAPPCIEDTMGRRETNNSTRVFFGVEIQRDFPVCAEMAQAFQNPQTIAALSKATGVKLDGTFLRIEYCQDTDGFWLEPHTDIGAKLFTMLVYLSDVPAAANWGTDIYDDALKHLGQAPGTFNKGLIFIPGANTWHGVEKRTFDGVRKSIIINYVVPEWRSRHELAFPELAVVSA